MLERWEREADEQDAAHSRLERFIGGGLVGRVEGARIHEGVRVRPLVDDGRTAGQVVAESLRNQAFLAYPRGDPRRDLRTPAAAAYLHLGPTVVLYRGVPTPIQDIPREDLELGRFATFCHAEDRLEPRAVLNNGAVGTNVPEMTATAINAMRDYAEREQRRQHHQRIPIDYGLTLGERIEEMTFEAMMVERVCYADIRPLPLSFNRMPALGGPFVPRPGLSISYNPNTGVNRLSLGPEDTDDSGGFNHRKCWAALDHTDAQGVTHTDCLRVVVRLRDDQYAFGRGEALANELVAMYNQPRDSSPQLKRQWLSREIQRLPSKEGMISIEAVMALIDTKFAVQNQADTGYVCKDG